MSMSSHPAATMPSHSDLGLSDSAAITATAVAQRGIDFCRIGHWHKGLRCLTAAIHGSASGCIQLPGGYYGFLGAALAKVEKRYKEGLEFCNVGLKKEFYLPDNYLNLARVYLAVGEEGQAYTSAQRGLSLDADNREIREFLRKEFPARKKPILRFLKRGNPINVMLGRFRHAIAGEEEAIG